MMPADQIPGLESDRVDVTALLRTLWAYKTIILLTTFVGGGIATFMALTAVPVFRAEATVSEVSQGNMGAAAALAGQLGGLASLVGVNIGGSVSSSHDAHALLNSRELAEEFIRQNQLIPTLYPLKSPLPSLWLAVRHFRDDVVAIRDDKRTGLTIISVSWTDPVVAAKWANQFVSLANELLRTRAIRESQASINYLNQQVLKTEVVDVRRAMYELIENETKTLMLANVKEEFAFKTIDRAVPPELRFSPRRTLIFLIGLAIGFMAGVIGVFTRQLFDTTTKTSSSNLRQ